MSEPLRVLVVHDSHADAQRIIDELERLDRPLACERVQEALGLRVALERSAIDLVLCAFSLPGFGALAALGVLRELGSSAPLIALTKTASMEHAVEAMRAGAADVLLVDQLERLQPAIERVLRASEQRRGEQRSELALAGEDARLRRIFDSGVLGIHVATFGGALVQANDAFLALIGYGRDELDAGTLHLDAITPKEWRSAELDAEQTLRTSGSYALREAEYQRKDGSKVPVLIGAAAIGGSEYVGYVLDIGERKRAEAGLRASDAQQRHAQTLDAVGRLAGGIAHDYNNLMSVVLTYAALIAQDCAPDDPKQSDLSEIRLAAEQAVGLTQQLLAFSRHQVMRPVVCDVNELLNGLRQLLEALLGDEIVLSYDCAGDLGKVLVDPKQLAQVVMNLAIHAREIMPQGGRFTLATSNTSLDAEQAAERQGLVPGRHVLLCAVDTSAGMDEAVRARAFEPFLSTKDRSTTSGLGLATALGIARQSGGDLWVESEPGHGSIFKLCLPVVSGTMRPRARRSDMPPRPSLPAANGRETILLVDDDDKVRASTLTVLRRLGYDTLEARNGAAALALGAQHRGPIHLLLTDVVTSSMSGTELAERLLQQRPTLKVVYLCGYAPDALSRPGALDPETPLIAKPITPETLGTTIRRVLDG